MRNKLLFIVVLSSILILISPVLADTVEYTTPGTHYWTVPAVVTSVDIIVVGGGGGGGGGDDSEGCGGAKGRAGQIVQQYSVAVTPASSITVVVGTKGSGGSGRVDDPGGSGTAGSQSSFDAYNATGGSGGSGSAYCGGAYYQDGEDGEDGYGTGTYASAGGAFDGYGGAAGVGRGAGGGGGGSGSSYFDPAGSGGNGADGYVLITYEIVDSPVAAFSGNPTSGTTPLEVTFTDSSTNTPTSWYWEFGDGNTSTSQNPVHEYAFSGTFSVNLQATNAGGSDWENKTSYITVSNPTPTPTATVTPTATITPSFPTYSGIHITDTTGITSIHATLNGYVDNAETDSIVWFELGLVPNSYTYKIANISSGTGTFAVLIESYPLIASKTYYARAVCSNGYSEEEENWTMTTASAVPTTSFGDRANNFMTTNMSLGVFWTDIVDTGGDIFGGGETGVMIFISVIGSIAFIVMFGRSGDVIIPLEVGVLVIGIILPFLAPEFAEIGYGLMIAAVIGVIYSIFRKS